MREYLEELRENWTDPYWRADHPEAMAIGIAVATGLIGLVFVYLEVRIRSTAK